MAKGDQGGLLISAGHMQSPPSSVRQMFHEAARLTGRTWKPLLYIFLIHLLPSTLASLGYFLTATPLILDLSKTLLTMLTKDTTSTEIRELLAAAIDDFGGITVSGVISTFFFSLLSAFLAIATVHTVAMADERAQVSLRDLLSKLRNGWKGPVATWLYLTVLGNGYSHMLLTLIVVSVFVSKGSAAVCVVVAVVATLASLLLLYLEVVWYEGIVVSVVEEDVGGLAALGRASELIRGRRCLGFKVNFSLALMFSVWSIPYSLVNSLLSPGNEWLSIGLSAVFYSGTHVIKMFRWTVLLVFYDECKRNQREETGFSESWAYTMVPSASPTTVDEVALP